MPPSRKIAAEPAPAAATVGLARSMYAEGARIGAILARTGLTIHQLYLWLDGGPPGACDADGLPLERIPRRREGMLGQRRLPLLTSRASLVNRLWRAAERQAAEIEARLASFGEDRDRERDARTLAVLARTVRELVAIDARRRAEEAADREAEDDDAMPRDLDALRDALARRIEQLRAERAQADAAGAAGEDARSSGT